MHLPAGKRSLVVQPFSWAQSSNVQGSLREAGARLVWLVLAKLGVRRKYGVSQTRQARSLGVHAWGSGRRKVGSGEGYGWEGTDRTVDEEDEGPWRRVCRRFGRNVFRQSRHALTNFL